MKKKEPLGKDPNGCIWYSQQKWFNGYSSAKNIE
jgi:hypothetical protein